jgi:hypothetical protein
MPDLSTLVWVAGVLLVIVVLVWFAAGTIGNIRKGNRMLEWLQQGGLPLIGRRTTLRWLGSNTVELKVQAANPPLKAAEVLVVLEPRDVSVLWWWGRARGRRDFLIFRGTLSRKPRFEVEAGDTRGWTGHDGFKYDRTSDWSETVWGGPEVQVAYPSGTDLTTVRQHWERLEAASGGVWRVSVRRDRDHQIEVHVLPPDITAVDSEGLVRAFVDFAAATR